MKKTYYKSYAAIILVVTAILATIIVIVSTVNEWYRFKSPPPGWTIVHDGHGRWGAKMSGSGYVIEDGFGGNPLASKQQAIDRAWAHWEWEISNTRSGARKVPKEPSEPSNWRPYDNTNN